MSNSYKNNTSTIEELSGTVDRFLFKNQENGFAVALLKIKKQDSIIITGTCASLQSGEHINAKGRWKTHAKFGKQFEIESYSSQPPSTPTGLIKYLSSGLIKGIGPVLAEKLVVHFGIEILTVIDQTPDRLCEVTGIGRGKMEQIIAGWKDQKEVASLMLFLQDKDISPGYALKIYKKYGTHARSLLEENPYRLCDDIGGISFKTADAIAQKLGIEPSSQTRIQAALVFILSQHNGAGSLYTELEKAKSATLDLLQFSQEQAQLLSRALHHLYASGKIKLITHEEIHYITLPACYFSEKGLATRLNNLQSEPSRHHFDLEAIYTKLRTISSHERPLHEMQQKAILSCLEHKVTIITGGPGTGKTTLIKQLLSLLGEHKISFTLTAPTGRAAQRLSESTGKHALTIHRLLEFDPSTGHFSFNDQRTLTTAFIIVDEMSMVDVFLAHSLIKAIPLYAHLILIGDSDQLPSVGPGNVLKDLILSNQFSSIHLTHIFRQARDSLIILNAHQVNQGKKLLFANSDKPKTDFYFIHENDPAQLQQRLPTLYEKVIRASGISAQDTTILTPMNRGIVGTQIINQHLQNYLNPQPLPSLSRIHQTFKVNDRVMHIKNNYDKNVFNGDTGIITSIDTSQEIVTVQYNQHQVTYELHELDELTLAYAITIHKSQGSEYPAIIIPLFMNHFTLLQRNLLYTALTRAKKLCILIGQPKAIALAIRNNQIAQRITLLPQFLTTSIACR
ncbi:MAG: ATP-dependent RecD-like DNA helicase [Candidatus Babeliales bacterium]